MGMSLSDYVVTEAGFASELGAEKFFDIKAQYGHLMPNASVIVATVRALKYHGGVALKDLEKPNLEAVKIGVQNLDKHVENIRFFNLNPVVALNKFSSDTDDEIQVIREHLQKQHVRFAINESWEKGGKGAVELAKMVVEATVECVNCFQPLYDFSWSIEKKINTVATEMYGAAGVEFSLKARKDLKMIEELGLQHLPVCIAKTQKSLSDKPELKNRPSGFIVNIREIEIASGAGFVIPIAGDIMRMPGLPEIPSSEFIDIDNEGNISGLF
jgi:formate--tetrahydrofolate ligase